MRWVGPILESIARAELATDVKEQEQLARPMSQVCSTVWLR